MTERQLDLLKGKRQRGKALPPPLERRVHIALADTLKIATKQTGWWYGHIPSGELRTEATGGLLKRMGTQPGMSDFLLFSPQGQAYWLELKRKGGRVSDAQALFHAEMTARTVTTTIAWSYEEALNILRAWGAVKVSL